MDLRFLHADGQEVIAEFTVGRQHLQTYGIVHGGVHCGVIETLASVGAALHALPRGQSVVGLENHTSFIRAVREGERLRATATPLTRAHHASMGSEHHHRRREAGGEGDGAALVPGAGGIEVKRQAFIVTGSSSGVGAATALLLAKEGAGVAVNFSRDAAPAEQVAQACLEAGGDAVAIRADVADDADCQRLAAAALDRWGRIDGLVNNAGTTRFVRMRDLDPLLAEDFHRIYSVNVIGPYQMVRACHAALRAAGGAVVNVSSIAGTMGIGSSHAYACSKGALNTLTLSLARALAPEIRVNAVLPGFVETRWLKQGLGAGYDQAREAYCDNSPLATVLQPEDVAASIVALLKAKKVTGQLHTIDAGRGLGMA